MKGQIDVLARARSVRLAQLNCKTAFDEIRIDTPVLFGDLSISKSVDAATQRITRAGARLRFFASATTAR